MTKRIKFTTPTGGKETVWDITETETALALQHAISREFGYTDAEQSFLATRDGKILEQGNIVHDIVEEGDTMIYGRLEREGI